jgi:F0F1-type ATP synthase delta subunit
MIIKDYITATYATLKRGCDYESTLSNVRKSLNERGYIVHYPAILKGLLRKVSEEKKRDAVVVTLGAARDQKSLQAEIDEVLHIYKLKDQEILFTVNEHIVGGFTVRTKNSYIDKSYKHALLQVYKRVTD